MALSDREKQAAFKDRKRKAGYVQMTVWVKKGKKEHLRKYVAGLSK